jgi:hypothetical protein
MSSNNLTNWSHLALLVAIGLVIKYLPEVAPYVAVVLAGGNALLASPIQKGS